MLIRVFCFLERLFMSRWTFLIKKIINIFRNFIPNKTILSSNRDTLWINEKIKSLIKNKNVFCRNQYKSKFWVHYFKCYDSMKYQQL